MIIWNTLKLENKTGSVSATVSGTQTAPIWNFNHPINVGRITTETLTVTSSLDIPVKSIDYNKLTGTPNVADLQVTNVATLNVAGITTATISNATINGGLVFGENAAPVTLPVGSKIPGTDTDGLVVGSKYTVYASEFQHSDPIKIRILNGSNKKLYCRFSSNPPTYDQMESDDRPGEVPTHFYLKPWEWTEISLTSLANVNLYCQTEVDASATKPTTPQFTFIPTDLAMDGGVYKTVPTDFWTDPGLVQLGQSSQLLICTATMYTEAGINGAFPVLYNIMAKIFNLYSFESHHTLNNGSPVNNMYYFIGSGIKQS